MNKVPVILAAVVLLLGISSCDFFRGIAGRPRSAQINEKRARIELAEAAKAARRDSVEKARLDSAARAEQYAADSLYALDSLTRCGKLRKASSVSNIPMKALKSRWYVVAGAFANEANAKRLAARFDDAGFETELLKYRSGLNAVLVAPSDRIPETFGAYRRIIKLPFASNQCWVLVNE